TVSHELRTPLTAILGWARMLRSGRVGGDAIARGLEVIDRNARLQAQLIEDLLGVSRIITGKLRLELRSIELAPVIDGAIDSVRDTAEAKGITIDCAVEPHLGLRGDPDRLQQVVWNLLSNAIKFTPAGGRVSVVARAAGAELEISVSDTGKGIEREFLPFVFERFRQSAMGRASGGLGLGLALVRHLTEGHGGTVAVHSEGPDRGATLTVRLPSATTNGETEAPATVLRPGARFPSLAGVRVLVVDDDDDARQLLAFVLEQCHAEVLTAASTHEALRRLENEKPDVVLSDINMPGADGYVLVRTLRERDGAGRVPVVALPASARGGARRRGAAAGRGLRGV